MSEVNLTGGDISIGSRNDPVLEVGRSGAIDDQQKLRIEENDCLQQEKELEVCLEVPDREEALYQEAIFDNVQPKNEVEASIEVPDREEALYQESSFDIVQPKSKMEAFPEVEDREEALYHEAGPHVRDESSNLMGTTATTPSSRV